VWFSTVFGLDGGGVGCCTTGPPGSQEEDLCCKLRLPAVAGSRCEPIALPRRVALDDGVLVEARELKDGGAAFGSKILPRGVSLPDFEPTCLGTAKEMTGAAGGIDITLLIGKLSSSRMSTEGLRRYCPGSKDERRAADCLEGGTSGALTSRAFRAFRLCATRLRAKKPRTTDCMRMIQSMCFFSHSCWSLLSCVWRTWRSRTVFTRSRTCRPRINFVIWTQALFLSARSLQRLMIDNLNLRMYLHHLCRTRAMR